MLTVLITCDVPPDCDARWEITGHGATHPARIAAVLRRAGWTTRDDAIEHVCPKHPTQPQPAGAP